MELVSRMVALAGLTRVAFAAGELSTVMSPRTVINWAQNADIFGQVERAFHLTFLNRCDEAERGIVAELYQRCFGVDVAADAIAAS
jgi:cobaltochelatase CobS